MKCRAYIDEAGEKGLVRRVDILRDDQIGLMCSLLVSEESEQLIKSAFEPHFNRFRAAAPEGAKIHITDAFQPGNQKWAEVANEVRSEGISLVENGDCAIIYDARRLQVIRESYEAKERLLDAARQSRRSDVRIPDRPDSERVDEQLVQGLILKLDTFAEDKNLDSIDLHFDEIDNSLHKSYEYVLQELQNIELRTRQVKGWDINEKRSVKGEIVTKIKTTFPLNVKHIGSLHVAGKNDALVLLADIVTNGLYNHLRSLASSIPLNAPASIVGWRLASKVWGVRDNAMEDLI